MAVEVKIIHFQGVSTPEYQTEGSSGVDLQANITKSVSLKPLERVLIPTGIKIEMPTGLEAQIRPRSGLALKKGITVLNSPGTIDSDYRGEIGVILINHSTVDYEVKSGERIAQLVFSKQENFHWKNVNYIDSSSRGEGGFGSTGTN
mgnify:CR=1 FL=1